MNKLKLWLTNAENLLDLLFTVALLLVAGGCWLVWNVGVSMIVIGSVVCTLAVLYRVALLFRSSDGGQSDA